MMPYITPPGCNFSCRPGHWTDNFDIAKGLDRLYVDIVTEALIDGWSWRLFFRLSSSQRMSDVRTSRSNYYIMLILRGVEPSSCTSVETQIIWLLTDGVLWFEFHINVDQGEFWGWGITLYWCNHFMAIH